MAKPEFTFFVCLLSLLWTSCCGSSVAEEAAKQDEFLVDLCQKGHPDRAISLKGHGGNSNAQDKYGWSLLHIAAGNNDKEMPQFLINKGADVNSKNGADVGILHAVSDTEIEQLLIAAGADINAKNKDGRTPLHWAVDFDRKYSRNH